MKIIVIAAIARNGVIGRSKKSCACTELRGALFNEHGCTFCEGHGYVPCNELPWPPSTYPEDMTHFRQKTEGHAVVMGRRTWESIPPRFRPLKGRDNVVVTSSRILLDEAYTDRHGHAQVWDTPELGHAITAMSARKHDKLYVIGGAQLYAEAIPLADELELTLIDKDYEGDVRFPGHENFEDMSFLLRDSKLHFPVSGVEHCRKIVEDVFNLAERRQGAAPELTFTKWVRR